MARPADQILKQSELMIRGRPDVYRLPLCLVDKTEGLYKYSIGSPSRSGFPKREKVLMLLGAKGAGKSTLINGMANYLLGVVFNDNFRFKVVTDEESGSQTRQPKKIIAYTFCSTILDYNLTVIDTPGFGTNEEEDKHIAMQIEMLFAEQTSRGIDVLSGIGLVTPASVAPLTLTQKNIFYAILSMFGRDIIDNIFLLATFAGAGYPPVVDAAKSAHVPFQQCFKFNNSALYCSTDDGELSFSSVFWQMGTRSFAHFFDHFNKVEMKSLTLTREVLKERQQLDAFIPGLQAQVKVGLNLLDAIQQEEAALKFHEKGIMENKNFTYYVTEQKIKRVNLPEGIHTTTCRKCNFTCHNDCIYPDDGSLANCCAMSGGYCTVCPNHCHWSNHSNIRYRYDYYTEKVAKTYYAQKELYEKAVSRKRQAERLLAEKRQQLDAMQKDVNSLMKQAEESNERLGCIALKPNTLAETNCLDLLVASEEAEMKPGWKERVKQYHVLFKGAKF